MNRRIEQIKAEIERVSVSLNEALQTGDIPFAQELECGLDDLYVELDLCSSGNGGAFHDID